MLLQVGGTTSNFRPFATNNELEIEGFQYLFLLYSYIIFEATAFVSVIDTGSLTRYNRLYTEKTDLELLHKLGAQMYEFMRMYQCHVFKVLQ